MLGGVPERIAMGPGLTMHIGVPAKGGADWIGGLHYTINLVKALATLPAGERPRISVFTSHAEQLRELHGLAGVSELVTLPPAREGAATELAPFERAVVERRVDVIYPVMQALPGRFPIPWIGWVPDLQHRRLAGHFSETERAERDERYRRLVAAAPRLVLSSAAAVGDFEEAYPGHAARLRVLQFATVPDGDWFEGDPRETAASLELPDRYFILPNQFWSHKNHVTAFRAVDILARRGLDVCLVCTGRMEDPRNPEHVPTLRRFLSERGLEGRVRLLGILPRRDQVQLVRQALAVVQPSLFEGWSTVVEDARALGKRILLSDIPVHREQNCAGAIYFEPTAAGALAEAMVDCWTRAAPGRDAHAESQAREEQGRRILDFARTFLGIAHEARAS